MAKLNPVAAQQIEAKVQGRRSREFIQQYGVLITLLLLVVFNIATNPGFRTPIGLLDAVNVNLTQIASTAIVAMGMTLVITSGGIDLSVGSVMAISGALAPLIFLSSLPPGIGFLLAILIPLGVGGLCGLFNSILITRFRFQPIIATLILFISGRGIAEVMTNGKIQVFTNPGFSFIGVGRILGIPFQVLLMVLIVLVTFWVMRATTFGRYVLSIGGSEKAARFAGIPANRVKILIYVVSGVLAALAGLIVIGINSASDATQVGLNVELDAIASVAVGGTSMLGGRARVIGTLLGALLIQLIRFTLITKNVPFAVAQVINAIIILLAVYIQTQRKS